MFKQHIFASKFCQQRLIFLNSEVEAAEAEYFLGREGRRHNDVAAQCHHSKQIVDDFIFSFGNSRAGNSSTS